jgi:hypothetical protein
MVGALENPLSATILMLQMLQEALVKAIGFTMPRGLEPMLI